MGVVASLIANLKANTVDFDSKLKKSAGGLKSFESQARAASAGITSAFARMAAAAGGIYLFKTAAQEADDYGKLAQTLGDTTANMQALAYAASQNDTSFESASGAMVKMRKAINEAMEGNKAASAAFQRLGLDVNALSQMSATEQFKTIADAINQAGAAAGNAGFDIFGRNVAEISVLLQAGSAAMDEASQKMKAFGLSNEQIQKIKDMKDRLEAFSIQAKSAAAQVVAAFGPGVTNALSSLSENIMGLLNWWNNLSGATRDWIRWAGEAATVAWALNKAMVFSAIGKSVDMIVSMVGGLRALVAAMRTTTIASEVSQAIATGGASLAKTALGIGASIAAIALVDRAFASTGASASANTGAIEANGQAARQAATEWTEYNRVMDEARKILDEHRSEIERINGIIGKYTADAKKLGAGEMAGQIEDIQRVAERTGMGLGWATAKVRELKEAIAQLDAAKRLVAFDEALAAARAETEKLTLSTKQLAELEWERAGYTEEQKFELRAILDHNERIRKSQEGQKKLAQEQRDAVKESARAQEEAARKVAEQRARDLDIVQRMEQDANPTIKYQVDKEELDRLKYSIGMSDDAYNFQLKKLQDELKKSMGLDSEIGTGGRLNQGYASARSGMLTYALMGGQGRDDEKVDRKMMVEYLRIMATEARDGRGRLAFPN